MPSCVADVEQQSEMLFYIFVLFRRLNESFYFAWGVLINIKEVSLVSNLPLGHWWSEEKN